MNEIKLLNPPVIKYIEAIEEIAESVKNRLERIDVANLVCNENTVKDIKKLRTEFKKEFDEYENQRKLIKESVNKPYSEFESLYKEKIASQYTRADSDLKISIDKVENGIKMEKQSHITNYFSELCLSKNIDFISFEKVGLNITLSASEKSLKEQVLNFIEKVESDLALIESQENSNRILVRYKKSLNVSQAIIDVSAEIKQELGLKRVNEEREAIRLQVLQEKEESKIPVFQEPTVVVTVPIVEQEESQEEVLTLRFTATASRTKLIKLREYMKKEGIIYE